MDPESILDLQANPKKVIQCETDRRNFMRAVVLAQQYEHAQSEIRRLQEMALKQMACEYRNSVGVRRLAQEWGFSRAEMESLLTNAVAEKESGATRARSDKCYDAATGKYLTLRQWVEQFLNMKK